MHAWQIGRPARYIPYYQRLMTPRAVTHEHTDAVLSYRAIACGATEAAGPPAPPMFPLPTSHLPHALRPRRYRTPPRPTFSIMYPFTLVTLFVPTLLPSARLLLNAKYVYIGPMLLAWICRQSSKGNAAAHLMEHATLQDRR